MGLTYRDIKGSPLSFSEMDSNIRHFTGSHSITGSLIIKSGSITISGSGNVITSNQTSSFATLGSNSFTGTQTITGSLILSSSSPASVQFGTSFIWTNPTSSLTFTGSMNVTGSVTVNGPIIVSGSGTTITSNQTGSFINNSQTGSFASTGSNNFTGNQTITGSMTITGSLTISGSNTLTNYGDLKNFNGDQIYYLDSGSREHKVLNYAVPSDATVIFLAAYSASISKIQMVNLPTTEAQASSFGTGSLWMSGSNGNSSYLMVYNP
jgi:hypothetical protein